MRTKKQLALVCSVVALLAGYSSAQAAVTPSAIFWGPTVYLSASDIPTGFYLGGSPILLDDLEDNSLDSSLTASAGSIIDASIWGTLVDSVDADDGSIDGLGNRGHSWFSGDVTFTYVGSGPMPTAFGLVWTDGSGAITFTATDALLQPDRPPGHRVHCNRSARAPQVEHQAPVVSAMPTGLFCSRPGHAVR